ncbi:hypothetical protein AcetOrient_orf03549 [Acetobacter orientalis]|uniref:Uncharacterized protein n=1 Tax=Acetobacter orientalis TaxID=146474 RepID=A0A2Z5ZIU5_9PROT|nr:hypothetical protein AcetOrient_orf03549 [Acetobacter orientalis]
MPACAPPQQKTPNFFLLLGFLEKRSTTVLRFFVPSLGR